MFYLPQNIQHRVKSHITSSHKLGIPELFNCNTVEIQNSCTNDMNAKDNGMNSVTMTRYFGGTLFLKFRVKVLSLIPQVSDMLKAVQNALIIKELCEKMEVKKYKNVIATVDK